MKLKIMKKELRIGVIGTGRFGEKHLIAFKQMEKPGNVKLVAMADIDEQKCQKFQQEYNIKTYKDYKKMIENEVLSAISIATPDHQHTEIVLYALEKGLHVLVEKPMTMNTVQGLKLVKMAEDKNLVLQVDFHKRYDPFHMEIKQMAENEKFGEFLYGYCHMENQISVPQNWFPHWAPKSSPGWFLGSNLMDLIGWLMNSNAKTVYATGQKQKLVSLGIDTFDSIQANVTYENGSVITYHVSWILPKQFSTITNQGFRLVGSEGFIEADSQDRGTHSCFTSEPVMKSHNSGFVYTIQHCDGTKEYSGYGISSIQHFAQNVLYLQEGGKIDDLKGHYPSGMEGLEVTKIVAAVHQSIDLGKIVRL